MTSFLFLGTEKKFFFLIQAPEEVIEAQPQQEEPLPLDPEENQQDPNEEEDHPEELDEGVHESSTTVKPVPVQTTPGSTSEIR